MVNVAYDIPLSNDMGLHVRRRHWRRQRRTAAIDAGFTDLVGGKHDRLHVAGHRRLHLFELTDNVDLTLDYRYRCAVGRSQVLRRLASMARALRTSADLNEQAVMLGFRWYLESPPPPPPPLRRRRLPRRRLRRRLRR